MYGNAMWNHKKWNGQPKYGNALNIYTNIILSKTCQSILDKNKQKPKIARQNTAPSMIKKHHKAVILSSKIQNNSLKKSSCFTRKLKAILKPTKK